jgi:hypothetical protein
MSKRGPDPLGCNPVAHGSAGSRKASRTQGYGLWFSISTFVMPSGHRLVIVAVVMSRFGIGTIRDLRGCRSVVAAVIVRWFSTFRARRKGRGCFGRIFHAML